MSLQDISIISEGLPALTALNLSNNSMSPVIHRTPQLSNIRVLVLNQTGVIWDQVKVSVFRCFQKISNPKESFISMICVNFQMEALKDALPHVEELHLMGNNLREITVTSYY